MSEHPTEGDVSWQHVKGEAGIEGLPIPLRSQDQALSAQGQMGDLGTSNLCVFQLAVAMESVKLSSSNSKERRLPWVENRQWLLRLGL